MEELKIDHRHRYGIMIDTETANGLDDPLFYDVGWQVIDSHGRKYAERSFINRDIFNGERNLMRTAYYADKIPMYIADLRAHKRTMASIWEIRKVLREDCEKYGCEFICAHNARFDNRALNGTMRYLTKSAVRWFVPFGLEWWDTMKMAQSVIWPMPTYRKFCEEHDYFTSRGQMRCTAEILYQFITGNPDFSESHTGLEDVDIERQILAYCTRQHKPMNRKLWGD